MGGHGGWAAAVRARGTAAAQSSRSECLFLRDCTAVLATRVWACMKHAACAQTLSARKQWELHAQDTCAMHRSVALQMSSTCWQACSTGIRRALQAAEDLRPLMRRVQPAGPGHPGRHQRAPALASRGAQTWGAPARQSKQQRQQGSSSKDRCQAQSGSTAPGLAGTGEALLVCIKANVRMHA